jgi:hypothetical protein
MIVDENHQTSRIFFVILQLMNRLRLLLLAGSLFLAGAMEAAENFFTTTGYSFVRRGGGQSYSVKVDFPVDGEAHALDSVKAWICDVLEVDDSQRLDETNFENIMRQSYETFLKEDSGMSRRIEIVRSYEDEEIVTYQSEVVDRDTATWHDEDCASFSKKDGHRLRVDEIFKCPERRIKQLMWQYRGDLPVGVSGPDELVVGDAGYIDGWVVVIGPAKGYTGAAYRIRYQVAEPYLQGKRTGGYYDGEEDDE